MAPLHASCVAVGGRGLLLCGPSGAGKSDLALRLIDEGARLVADDQVILRAVGGRLIANAPESLAGLLEIRGVGIVRLPYDAEAELSLAAELVDPRDVPRLPEADTMTINGVALPVVRVAPFEASAPAKLRLAAGASAADIPAIIR